MEASLLIIILTRYLSESPGPSELPWDIADFLLSEAVFVEINRLSKQNNSKERGKRNTREHEVLQCCAGNAISSMDWDVGGDRLAVGFGGDHPDAGKVGLYSTTCQPVVSAQLIGKISSGNSDKPVQAVKFHTKYSRGALLAILSCSKQISILPLLYKLA